MRVVVTSSNRMLPCRKTIQSSMNGKHRHCGASLIRRLISTTERRRISRKHFVWVVAQGCGEAPAPWALICWAFGPEQQPKPTDDERRLVRRPMNHRDGAGGVLAVRLLSFVVGLRTRSRNSEELFLNAR